MREKKVQGEQFFQATGILQNNVDVADEAKVRVVVENVGGGNTIIIRGKIVGQTAWIDLGTLSGAVNTLVNVNSYDLLQIECTVYSASGGIPRFVISSFEVASGSTIDIIGVPAGSDISDMTDGFSFTSNDSSVTITGDNTTKEIDFSIGVVSIQKWKDPARAATTANIVLSGAQTIDGVSVIAGDRVLVKDQTLSENNGIYVAAAGAWSRSSDANTAAEILNMALFIAEGTVAADKGYVCTADDPITLGTTPLPFTQFTTVAPTAGNGIDITANVVSIDFATDPGLEFNSAKLRAKVNAAGAINRNSSGLGLNLEASNPSLQISGNELGVKFSATTSALQKGSGGLQVVVDAATVKRNVSNELESLKNTEEIKTLNGTDITNQYVDLAVAAYSTASVFVVPVGGPMGQQGQEFSVSLTGGVAGVTRVTFLNDYATAGLSELVSGDILIIRYSYL